MIVKYFEDLDIKMLMYPKNMTDQLQVLDLVVNGPIKQHMRRYRAKAQKKSMQKYVLWREAQEMLPE